MYNNRFLLSALVDFPDDCAHIPFTADLLAQLMDALQHMGVRRVYWNYYQPGAWTFFADLLPATTQTLQNLGEPMAQGRRLAHARGMEFYAVIKPYETGMSSTEPTPAAGTAGAAGLPAIGGRYTRLDPWVLARPELRVRARRADLPPAELARLPITRIQLRQENDHAIGLQPHQLQLWVSETNHGYRPLAVDFTLSEGVEPAARHVFDVDGAPLTRQGEPVRVWNLDGLHLEAPFVALTSSGSPLCNTALEMVRAFGPQGQPLPIVVASHHAVWRPQRDLRRDDLQFDGGLGDCRVCLGTESEAAGAAQPVPSAVALARGRNEYLSGALCEAYPEVQAYWLDWVGDCLQAGVDGVDVRISNHSCWTDTPQIYGFNQPVTAAYQSRYGIDPDREPYDAEQMAALRGEFFDQFLRAVKGRLTAAGKPLQLHLESESFRDDSCQARWRTRPGAVTFQWRRWLQSGLADEATLFGRGWTPERLLADPLSLEMVREAVAHGVPTHLSKQVGSGDGRELADWVERVYRHDTFAGYTLYETAAMFDRHRLDDAGRLQFRPGLVEAIGERMVGLGLD